MSTGTMEEFHNKKQVATVTTHPDGALLAAIELQQQGKMPAAEAAFRDILRTDPDNAAVLYSLTVIMLNSGRREEALQFATAGVDVHPEVAQLWFAQGAVFQALLRRDEALSSFDRALAVNPDFIEVLVNSGALLHEMHRHHDALKRFHRALEIDPQHENALGNYGILLSEFKLDQQAVATFEKLATKNPDYPYVLGLLCFERLHLCDWTGLDMLTSMITQRIRDGRKSSKTLGYMALSDSAADHFRCARIFAQDQHPGRPEPLWRGERYGHARLRIAYVSPDLREHPVGHLMAGVIEAHDKSRFETIAISTGINDNSRIRSRMISAFEHFVDARDMTALQIAKLMRLMEVDIAVDLAGYTTDARPGIFLHRPAPVQVNYLGYPGTMALDCYDHIIADRVVLPEAHRAHYAEQPVYLDHCYLPVASGIQIAEPQPRSAYGLPEDGFVFCAFSHDFKIHPHVFSAWMKLLEANPGSVLWLMSRNDVSQQNLHKAAQQHGIAPERIVFATRVPRVEDHLARYRVADLFLDTWPYNAHTTAADALLAGLPVVTYMGDAFPARVAASLLTTLGFEQLITHSIEDYFALANGLAQDRARLKGLKTALTETMQRGHPFLGASFTRSLERAYEQMASTRTGQSGQAGQQVTSEIGNTLLLTAAALYREQNFPQAELFARSCLANDPGNADAAQLLADLRHAYGISDDFELSENAVANHAAPRYLLIKAWGYGFWSELHHLASQLLIAELTQRTPIVIWGRNCLFARDGEVDAFPHFFEPVSTARIEDMPEDATIFPGKWTRANLLAENVNKWEGEGSRLAAQFLFDRSETLLVSDFYSTLASIIPWIGRSSKYFGLSEDALYARLMQSWFKPSVEIATRADAFFAEKMQGRPWAAVHVRGSDKILESPHLEKTNAAYFEFVDRIVELNPTIGIFLLTDSDPVRHDYQQRYGERLLVTPALRTASDVGIHLSGHDGRMVGGEVLIDSLLALKCQYFIGNRESNTSLGIASMRDWPKGYLFLLGQANVRGENVFLHRREEERRAES